MYGSDLKANKTHSKQTPSIHKQMSPNPQIKVAWKKSPSQNFAEEQSITDIAL